MRKKFSAETRAKMSAAQKRRYLMKRMESAVVNPPELESRPWKLPPVPTPTAKETKARRFVLDRAFDGTGTSGIGIVAEGVQFSNGQVVIHWLSQLEAINVYANAVVLEQLHGHGGNTTIKWLDP